MEIKYEVHTIENVQGTGRERQYIRLRLHQQMSDADVEKDIQEATSLTTADVKAVMDAISKVALRELSIGNRFHLPGLGYLSLSVTNVPPSEKRDGRLTGHDIRLHGLNFRPEKQLMESLDRTVSFVRDDRSTRSARYSEQQLWTELEAYLKENRYITCTQMRHAFHLSEGTSRKWLTLFTADGRLKKGGPKNQALYFLGEEEL